MATVTDRNGNPVRDGNGNPVTSNDRNSTQGSRETNTSSNIDINGAAAGVGASAVSAVFNPIGNTVGGMIGGALGGLAGNLLGGVLGGLFGLNRNPLEEFASYNYIFTLSCLSNFELNLPDFTYKFFGPRNIILQSGGTPSKIPTLSELFNGGGGTEYFIDDVEIVHVVTHNQRSKQSDAAQFTFKIFEPYSMGNLLEQLQTSAMIAGHKNYLDAPFMLSLDFVGIDDNGNAKKAFGSSRNFPIKIIDVRFSVTEGGSTYEVVASPYQQSRAFADSTQQALTDIQIQGRTVAEALQSGLESLTATLNTRALKNEESGQVSKADKFVIMFPTSSSSAEESILGIKLPDQGATVAPGNEREEPLAAERKRELFESIGGPAEGQIPADFDAKIKETLGISIERSAVAENIRDYAQLEENINSIGQSKLVTDPTEATEQTSGNAQLCEMGESPGQICRAQLQVSETTKSFQFTANTKIQTMIEEVLLASEWGQGIRERLEQPDANGMVEWFKIESQVFGMMDGKTVDQTGQEPVIIVYRVVPFKVSASRFNSPSKANPLGTLFAMVPREYNYIYTGENKDILDFDIKFDNAFFVAVGATRGQNSGGNRLRGQNSMTANNSSNNTNTRLNEGDSSGTSASGQRRVNDTTTTSSGQQGGAGQTENTNISIARMFNNAILNSPSDLIEIDLKIWGDPYYLSDSGMGNYIAAPSFNININSDGAMEYQRSEVDIRLNFQSPIDYAPDGYMQFPGLGLAPVKAFSGLYQVVEVISNFSGGVFEQTLKCIRRQNQEIDIMSIFTKGGNALVEEGTEENTIDPNENGAT